MMLADEERARTCFAAAVASAQPLEQKHVPLLEKLLERQMLAKDLAGSARTAELMARSARPRRARGAPPARGARLPRGGRSPACACGRRARGRERSV